MLRTATRPKWLGLLVVALACAALAVFLGRWQWASAHDRAREEAVREVQARPVEPIADAIPVSYTHLTLPTNREV